MDPCDFDYVNEFISEACDMLKDNILENIEYITISFSDRDQLYHTLVDMFGKYLFNHHKSYNCYINR